MKTRPFVYPGVLAGMVWLGIGLAGPAHGQIASPGGMADRNVFSISLFAPVQLVPPDQMVSGLRLNLIYGNNRRMEGTDIGLINGSSETGSGLNLGALNLALGNSFGLRAALVNFTAGEAGGWAVGGYNHANRFTGTQIGGVNFAAEFVRTPINSARQIGLLNLTGSLEGGGFQLGLINLAAKGGVFPIMPFLNWNWR